MALNSTDEKEDAKVDAQTGSPIINGNNTDIIIKAKEEPQLIKKSMDEYSDNVLARLQLLITKLQKNLIRLEKNIDDSRMMISSSGTELDNKGETQS